MQIVIKQIDEKNWLADRPCMAGSPVVGRGKTAADAFLQLFLNTRGDICNRKPVTKFDIKVEKL